MSALSKAAPNPPSTGHPTDAQLHGVTANLSHPMADRPPRTLGDLLAASINAFARAPAILAPNRDPLTYMDLGRQLSAAARALAEAGYGGRSRIGVALPPGAECAVAVLAVCANAVCAPLNPELDEATLRRLLVAMRIDALIVPQGEDSPIVRAARRAGVALVGVRFDAKSLAGTLALIPEERRQPVALTAPRADDVALLTHTSGTTSTPKIVPLTHRVMAESALAHIEIRGLTPQDRGMVAAPLHSVAGIRRNLLPPLLLGGSVVCPAGLDPALLVASLQRDSPTHYWASAGTHMAILEELERHDPPIRHALRFVLSGASSLPSSAAERLERTLGVPVLEGYGITETGSIAQAPVPPARAPRGSVGRPANAIVAIMDGDGGTLGAEETGEIVVQGPELFGGYEDNADADSAAFRDGWFRTGDLGHLDLDGFLFISGRIKDIINRGGAKIAPSEVEDALAHHPSIVEAAAFAMPHPTLGEDVAAAVVLRGDRAATESELRDFVRTRLAAFKVPTRIFAVTELPKGPLGKVRRGELADVARRCRTALVPPSNSEEAEVVSIFAEVLDLERISVEDNFFQLGGDSLRGTRVIARLEACFGVTVPLTALFARPTAGAIASEIRAARVDGRTGVPESIVPIARHA